MTYWDLRTPAPVHVTDLSPDLTDEALAVAVSHDGRFVATAGSGQVSLGRLRAAAALVCCRAGQRSAVEPGEHTALHGKRSNASTAATAAAAAPHSAHEGARAPRRLSRAYAHSALTATVPAHVARAQVVKLWDYASRQLVAEGRGHSGDVGALRFAADDRQLVSAGMDSSVLVWNVYA
jgi:WD domain, G-beta repeat